jgi:O-antigen/teichoic acid export membrane protein
MTAGLDTAANRRVFRSVTADHLLSPPSRARLTADTLAAKSAELATQAALLLLVPRALGPDAYGGFAVAFGAVSVLSLGLGLGASIAAVRYLPAVAGEERLARTRAVAVSVGRSRVRVLGALTAAALVAGPLVLDVPVGVTLAVCAAAWSSVGSSIASELALGLGRHRVWNARFPLENGLVVAGAPAGHALLGGDGAIYGMALGCVLAFAMLAPRAMAGLRGTPAGDPLPPEAVGYARLQTATVILGTVVMRGAPLAMPLLGASSVQTGYAAVATGVGAAGAGTIIGLMMVQLPRLVQIREESRERAEHDGAFSARVALAIALAAALPAALLATPLLELALGSEFAGARGAFELALPAIPLGAAYAFASVAASLRLRPAGLTQAWGLGVAAFVVVAAATIPSLDAEGASLAMTAGMLTACLATTVTVGGREVRRVCALAIAAAAVVLGAGAIGL